MTITQIVLRLGEAGKNCVYEPLGCSTLMTEGCPNLQRQWIELAHVKYLGIFCLQQNLSVNRFWMYVLAFFSDVCSFNSFESWSPPNIHREAGLERTVLPHDTVSCICMVPTRTACSTAGYSSTAVVSYSVKSLLVCMIRLFKNEEVMWGYTWTLFCNVGWRNHCLPAGCSLHSTATSPRQRRC